MSEYYPALHTVTVTVPTHADPAGQGIQLVEPLPNSSAYVPV